MLMLGVGEKKAINGIITILWRKHKAIVDMEERRVRIAVIVCQRLQIVASGSRWKGSKGGQSMIARIEPLMLAQEERKSLYRSPRQPGDKFGGKGGQ